MAVGPVRALLVAHAQTSLSRMRQRGPGADLTSLVVIVVSAVIALPFIAACAGFMGWGAGLALEHRWGAAGLGVALALPPLLFGVLGGMVDGSRVLVWETFRLYPLKRRTLFIAELLGSFGDATTIAVTVGLAAFWGGFTVQRSAIGLFLLPAFAMSLLWMVFIQQAVSGLAQALVKRLRLAVTLLLFAAWAGGQLLATPRDATPKLDRALALRVRDAIERALDLLGYLPTTLAVSGARKLAEGAVAEGLRLQLPALVATLALGALAFWSLSREMRASELAVKSAGLEKAWGWGLSSPALAVARLHLTHLMSTQLGRFGLLMPLVAVVILKGPLTALRGAGLYAVPGAIAYVALGNKGTAYNQFGIDGAGLTGLLLLPIRTEDILRGKLLGSFVYGGAQMLLLLILLSLLGQGSPLVVAAAVPLAAAMTLLNASVGQLVSVWNPRRVAFETLQRNTVPFVVVLIHLGLALVETTVLGGSFAMTLQFAPHLLLPLAVSTLVATSLVARALLPFTVRFFEARRERILAVLAG